MATIDLDKPLELLTTESIAALPAQLGVYEVADADNEIIAIGYAGGRDLFGLRTALERELAAGAAKFRCEITHGYMTRWHELLMAHVARFGSLPAANANDEGRIGRLSP
jgi:hypothetical protein